MHPLRDGASRRERLEVIYCSAFLCVDDGAPGYTSYFPIYFRRFGNLSGDLNISMVVFLLFFIPEALAVIGIGLRDRGTESPTPRA